MAQKRPHIGLVLTGGGARAAYQVGVLRAIAAMVPKGAPTPFDVLCGTSAGAINAAALAANAGNFRLGVRRLVNVWKNLHAGHVYRADLAGIAVCSVRWMASLFLGAIGARKPVSLLDNTPLQRDLNIVSGPPTPAGWIAEGRDPELERALLQSLSGAFSH